MNIREILKNEEGQSIFELVLFLPIFLYLLVVLINIGNSINTSINQQKATRGYTHYLMKGNSYAFNKSELKAYEDAAAGFELVGAYIIGWRYKTGSSNQSSVGSFFNLPNVPFSGNDRENCEEKTDGNKSHCIKIFTFYGVCGETYGRNGNNNIDIINYPGSSKPISDKSSCVLN